MLKTQDQSCDNSSFSHPKKGSLKSYTYPMRGTCSTQVHFSLDSENCIYDLSFVGGCNGNLAGIASLVEGMPAEWVIKHCKNIPCGLKDTSCPDQLARALEDALNEG